MVRYLKLIPLFFLLSQNAHSAVTSVSNARQMSLGEAIKLASSQNLDFQQATLAFDSAKINYDSAWRTFFLPNVSLTTTSTSTHTLGAYPGTPASNTWKDNLNHGSPSSEIKLSLASYTLFNFWRDRIAYDIAKLSFERAEQTLAEAKRNLQLQITNAYFQAKLNQEVLEASQRSQQIAETILRLVKSRVPLKLATQNEVDSATVDMNDAKVQVEANSTLYQNGLYSFNALLNLPITTLLDLTTPLEYKPITLNLENALSQFKLTAPTVRNSKLSFQSAQGSLELAEKNRLPLPVVSFSGLTVGYGTNYTGGVTDYSSSSSGGRFEVQAAINLTLPIFGPGGFLGSDLVQASRIQLESAELQLQSALLSGEVQVRSLFIQIKHIQEQLLTIRQSFDSSSQLLDRMVTQLSNRPANRLELRDALASARTSELSYLQTTYNYISTKNSILAFVGIDPEEYK